MSAFAAPIQVLVDADNVFPDRLQPVLDLLGRTDRHIRLIAAGHERALARVSWPQETPALTVELIEAAGWQSADVVLAQAYSPGFEPLMLVSGDGDFALLADRHDGPVLVISGAASGRLRAVATVLDPTIDGLAPIVRWLAAV